MGLSLNRAFCAERGDLNGQDYFRRMRIQLARETRISKRPFNPFGVRVAIFIMAPLVYFKEVEKNFPWSRFWGSFSQRCSENSVGGGFSDQKSVSWAWTAITEKGGLLSLSKSETKTFPWIEQSLSSVREWAWWSSERVRSHFFPVCALFGEL